MSIIPLPSQNTLAIPAYTRQVLCGLMTPQLPRERFFNLFCNYLNGRSEKEIQQAVEIIFESRLSDKPIAAFNARAVLLKLVDIGKGQDIAGRAISKHASECNTPWDGEEKLKALFDKYKPIAPF